MTKPCERCGHPAYAHSGSYPICSWSANGRSCGCIGYRYPVGEANDHALWMAALGWLMVGLVILAGLGHWPWE